MTDTNELIKEEGRQAHDSGVHLEENPYKRASRSSARMWAKGCDEAWERNLERAFS